MRLKRFITLILTVSSLTLSADDQTSTVSPILPASELPFSVSIELADFTLPIGIQSFASATYKNMWVLIAGRSNGLHGFSDDGAANFPPRKQNTTVYVVDYRNGITYSKSLADPSSGLTAEQITQLSVTSPQFYQSEKTLYMAGGYGVDVNGNFTTMDVLSAISLPGIIHWVTHNCSHGTAAEHIRQISDPVFQETGGFMGHEAGDISLLIFGQNFQGGYTSGSNGVYSEQVQRFKLKDNGKKLKVKVLNPLPRVKNPNYRRRDLNVVPSMSGTTHHPFSCYVAYSGVFTESGGAWTVPVVISPYGTPYMANPDDPTTFKQGMNNYDCANAGLYSHDNREMYTIFFGGISLGYFQNGVYVKDEELPFINQVTTIKWDKNGIFTQYIMDGEYPVVPSTGTNPGTPLLFGADAQFFPNPKLRRYDNDVLQFDRLKCKSVTIGYIVGGIATTVPNDGTPNDSTASPYVFRVVLKPKPKPID